MSGPWQDPVVRILGTRGGVVGTGVLVECPQYGPVVLTAAHVVNAVFAPERSEYTAERPDANAHIPFDLPFRGNGGPYKGRVIEWAAPRPPERRVGPVTDVALLAMLNEERALPPGGARILNPDDFQALPDEELKGCEVRCYGFPDRGGQGRYAFGEIQGPGVGGLLHLVAQDDRGRFIEPGFSGAPLFDNRGRKVLGMAFTMDADGANRLAFAVPTRLLWRACPQLARPYRGLKVFEELDAAFFFGRENFVAALLKKAASRSIVGVTAASGAGKSSAIRAGLLPRIRREYNAVVLAMRPYDDPWKQLADALVPRLFPDDQPGERPGRARQKVAELRENFTVLCDDARTILEEEGKSRLVIFVDQFEELFTAGDAGRLANGTDGRPDFRDLMVATAQLSGRAGAPKLQWLYALRGDFADRAFRYPAFKDAVGEGNEFLADMRPEELRDAIKKPAAALDVEFEGGTDTQPGLVERIARDAGATVGSLPLMQHVLEELWDGMRERCLSHKAYEDLGELTGALDRHADAVLAALTAENQLLVPRLFSRLVNLKEDGQASRRVAWRHELEAFDPALWSLAVQLATEIERINQEPVRGRLLAIAGGVTAQSSQTGEIQLGSIAPTRAAAREVDFSADGTVEVAHEALLRHWSKLRDWISDQREFLLWRNKLDRRIAELDEYLHNRAEPHSENIPPEYLLRGTLLAEAVRWSESRQNDFDKKQVAFLAKSKSAAEIEEKRLERERQEKVDAARRQEEMETELQKLRRYVTPSGQKFFKISTAELPATEIIETPASKIAMDHASSPNWALEAIGADRSPFTGRGVTIGCIDTGLDFSHPAFAGLEIVQKTFSKKENTDDWIDHGTAIVSVILGRPVGGRRIGVAPGVKKLVFAKMAKNPESDSVLQALLWLRECGVDIVHLGFGIDFIRYGEWLEQSGAGARQAFAKVLDAHHEYTRLFETFMNFLRIDEDQSVRGTLIFTGAGNDSDVNNRVPVTSPIAKARGVISVGAIGRGEDGLEAAAFTNLGSTICAPGVEVPVAKPGGGFSTMSGTTLSCAVAVGTAALWWEYANSQGASAVRARDIAALLLASATKKGFAAGTDQGLLGDGLIVAPDGDPQTAAVLRDRSNLPRDEDVISVTPVVPLTSRQ